MIQKKEPLVSVIVPIYKVERYIETCINSILAQTYSNIEIVLVDDGSPDNCPSICDRYAYEDSRIIVLHKNNGGLSDARNAGMKVATGDYFLFVDSDDFVFPSIVEDLIRAMQREKSELTMCQCVCCAEKDSLETIIQPKMTENITTFYGRDKMYSYLVTNDIDTVAWKKLYDRKLFKRIEFPIGKLHEDAFIMYKLIDEANSITVTNQVGYIYRKNPQSIMNSSFSTKRLDLIDAKIEQNSFIESFYPDLIRFSESGIVYACNFCLKNMALSNYSNKDTDDYIQQLYRHYLLSYLSVNNVSTMGKLLALISSANIGIAKCILRFCYILQKIVNDIVYC